MDDMCGPDISSAGTCCVVGSLHDHSETWPDAFDPSCEASPWCTVGHTFGDVRTAAVIVRRDVVGTSPSFNSGFLTCLDNRCTTRTLDRETWGNVSGPYIVIGTIAAIAAAGRLKLGAQLSRIYQREGESCLSSVGWW